MSPEPLLLLHAGGMDSRMWQPLATELGDGYDVLAPDLGAAPVDEALALLDAHGVERAIVVGASAGGNGALELITRAPERVAGLVLFAATLFDHDFSPEIKEFWAAEEALVAAGDIEGAAALNVRAWVRDPAVAGLVEAMVRDDLSGGDAGEIPELPIDLAAIRAPTLAVSGGLDFPDFAAMADRIAATVPGARRAEVPDAGHLIALERPRAAADLVRGALTTR
ncbi:MAG: alpha/beta fold hydrolase [Solirubrobacteraceae bacterium]